MLCANLSFLLLYINMCMCSRNVQIDAPNVAQRLTTLKHLPMHGCSAVVGDDALDTISSCDYVAFM